MERSWGGCVVVIESSVVVYAMEVVQVEVESHSCHTTCVERASVGCHTESKLEQYRCCCVLDPNEHDELQDDPNVVA